MKFRSQAAGAAVVLAVAAVTPAVVDGHVKRAAAAEPVIIIDAPDLRKISDRTIGPRFSSLLGQPVFSNSGKLLGEVEDFVTARGGGMFAVIDTNEGPLGELEDLIDDEIVIVSLRELRRGPAPVAR